LKFVVEWIAVRSQTSEVLKTSEVFCFQVLALHSRAEAVIVNS